MTGDMIVSVLFGVGVGVAATVTMDVLGAFTRRLGLAAGAKGTCVFPWFLVLPALGFGVFGVKGPPELKLFTSSVLNHLFYGVGLWWSCNLLQFVS